jgi:hypothetical protein
MTDLTDGVYAGVGAPGDGDMRRSRQAQHRRHRLFQHLLDRAELGLACPARKRGAVVGEVQT